MQEILDLASFTRFDVMCMKIATCEAFSVSLPEVRRMPYRDWVQCLVVAEVQAARARKARQDAAARKNSGGGGTVPHMPRPLPRPRRGR